MSEQAEHYGVQARRAATRARSPRSEHQAILSTAAIWDARGEYDALLEDAQATERAIKRHKMTALDDGSFNVYLVAARAQFERGDFVEGRLWIDKCIDAVEGITNSPQDISRVIGHIARITRDQKYFEWAAELATRTVASDNSGRSPRFIQTILNTFIVVNENDSARALAMYEGVSEAPTLQIYGPCTARILGLLARTAGDRGAAANHFEEALTFTRNAGYKPELAWTCHDYAEMLLVSPGTADRLAVSVLLDEGSAITEELGMTPLGERLAALREIVGEDKAAHPAGLTTREVEVLKELAAGKSNPEIGQVLFITTNTVNRHVSNIFMKTGVANRVGATVFARDNGLAAGG